MPLPTEPKPLLISYHNQYFAHFKNYHMYASLMTKPTQPASVTVASYQTS